MALLFWGKADRCLQPAAAGATGTAVLDDDHAVGGNGGNPTTRAGTIPEARAASPNRPHRDVAPVLNSRNTAVDKRLTRSNESRATAAPGHVGGKDGTGMEVVNVRFKVYFSAHHYRVLVIAAMV